MEKKEDDNVKVAVRSRPLNSREKKIKAKMVVEVDAASNQMTLKKPSDMKSSKLFRFDYVYGSKSTQKEIYEDTAYPLVESVLEGYNGTIFAYGQTGCGKTFTMEGPQSDDLQGIIPRVFQHIFDKVDCDSDHSNKFLIRAGYIEIYNEDIRDLLGDDPMKKLNLREDPDRGVYVKDLTMVTVKTVFDTQSLMDKGRSSRVVGRTNMNAVSSRSHAIFVLNVETSTKDPDSEDDKIKAGMLNLVDLAGSERQGKTGAQGVRFKEATKINLSLSALGNVISALVEGKGKHIPYRDSKLTRLLQNSLGGNTKTVMIACVSPSDDSYDETLSTLRYANRAKNIKNKPKINEDPKDALLKQYQDEIKKLKQMLRDGLKVGRSPSMKSNSTMSSEREKEIVTRTVTKEVMVRDKKLSAKYKKLQMELERTRDAHLTHKTLAEQLLGAKDEENEAKQGDIMEQVYLLESELLEGGGGSDKARQRLDDMKSKRNRRNEQRNGGIDMSSSSGSVRSGDRKWKSRYKEAQSEIEDLMAEFEGQRTDLLQDIRVTHREMALYRTIVYKLMASSTVDEILYQSQWDSQREIWILPKFMDNLSMNGNTNKSSRTKRDYNSNHNRRSGKQNVPSSVQSVQQHIESMNWKNTDAFNGEDGFGGNGIVEPQDIDNFDLDDIQTLSNHNEFEDLEIRNREEIGSKQIDVDDHFLQQISELQDENKGFQPRMSCDDHGFPNKDIEVEDDFINQLSTIQDVTTFTEEITASRSADMDIAGMMDREFLVEKDREDDGIMDIANLMVQDKPALVEIGGMDQDEDEEFVSMEKGDVSEYDDVLAQMMGGQVPNENLFQRHQNGLLAKQDIDAADFYDDESSNEECSVDVTQLHGILNRKM